MDFVVKNEIIESVEPPNIREMSVVPAPLQRNAVIDLSSSGSDSEEEGGGEAWLKRSSERRPAKKSRSAAMDLPPGFLDPLPQTKPLSLPPPATKPQASLVGRRQFWKAGDFEEIQNPNSLTSALGMDHVRVHPKFLHSNATSHKWALGALAELLDNAFDEVCNGATFVNVDMLINKKDGSKMLLVEDNGGGMDPDKMRQCMSLGYSVKCKVVNTIGQYGNGFKTSTMRLGADVIVFSRSGGKEGKRPTQSIGMLSYTFLKNTGKEDIVVPMLDYEKDQSWNKIVRSNLADWNNNIDTIIQWSPYSSETDLLEQFSYIKDQGSRIVIYNLWEDDQGELELDFDADRHDIQIRGVNRDEKKIEMAQKFPNSRHFLTYRHSLRSYASILYLRLPSFFRMILRGKDIEHHNIVNDMMMKQEVTYRPQSVSAVFPKDPNMIAVVTVGFVKDAKHHMDVQGFNVYHKNRLIKPFWRVWTAAGSDGRGVIGVLEANFIEPAHDKQDFERTTILSRLEAKLVQMQKSYWATNCHKIGYAPRINKKNIESGDKADSSPEPSSHQLSQHSKKANSPNTDIGKSGDSHKMGYKSILSGKTGKANESGTQKKLNFASSIGSKKKGTKNLELQSSSPGTRDVSDGSDSETECVPLDKITHHSSTCKSSPQKITEKTTGSILSSSSYSFKNGTHESHTTSGIVGIQRITTRSQTKSVERVLSPTVTVQNELNIENSIIKQLKDENEELKKRIKKMEESASQELQEERDRNKSLQEKLEVAKQKLEEANKEQDALIDVFAEERNGRLKEEENLRNKLKDASRTIQELMEKRSKS
ncbi:protein MICRORCHIDIA 7-like isoform X1 [Zingiber officinale]|uniref:protein MICRORCHIDIA 7-like isoform X1 n=1 Tax=Zingiber officinale TaxID=94328 RepID=UPI001C4D77C9|nr:protein MICRORCHIDIA 7-like isoform X1 [Zingiber officinale]